MLHNVAFSGTVCSAPLVRFLSALDSLRRVKVVPVYDQVIILT